MPYIYRGGLAYFPHTLTALFPDDTALNIASALSDGELPAVMLAVLATALRLAGVACTFCPTLLAALLVVDLGGRGAGDSSDGVLVSIGLSLSPSVLFPPADFLSRRFHL